MQPTSLIIKTHVVPQSIDPPLHAPGPGWPEVGGSQIPFVQESPSHMFPHLPQLYGCPKQEWE